MNGRAPGVYIEPADPTVRPVAPARSDVAAFIGIAERGPDQTDHPRAVVVAHDEHVTRRRQVDDVLVEPDDARRVELAVQRSGDVRGPTTGDTAHGHEVDVVARGSRAGRERGRGTA